VQSLDQVPLIWDRGREFRERVEGRTTVVFLDYDGTLTPIVEDRTQAFLADEMRRTIATLARRHTVAIVSGRDLAILRELVGLGCLFYAGSHGFELGGPDGWHEAIDQDVEALPELDRAAAELRHELAGIPGHAVERKRFAVAIHYRRAAAADASRIARALDRVPARHPRLRKGSGKKVWRLQPDIEWNKGRAVLLLLQRLDLDRPRIVPIYIGDDVTDEDAFHALQGRGVGIVVRGEDCARETAAQYALADCDDVRRFLELLIALEPKSPS
jgi:trehalose 6-phosphate phosphatase